MPPCVVVEVPDAHGDEGSPDRANQRRRSRPLTHSGRAEIPRGDVEEHRGGIEILELVGDTVRRPPNPNSPFVHKLLAHLREQGFPGAPNYLGTDEQGREIFSFIPGDVPADLDPTISDETLASAAQLIRRYQDATASSDLVRHEEVVCHNDLSPCNFVFRENKRATERAPCQTERVSVSVVIPTIGRETLRATLESVAPQLERGDEVLVVGDGRPARAREIFARERRRRWRYLETDGPCNDGGGTQRDLAATVARGDHLCFMDDDDIFAPGALGAIRRGVAEHPQRVLLFRMDNYGTLRWRDREIRYGNVGTPMVVVPNDPARLPSWRFGDYEFIRQSCKRLGEPVWRDEVVAVVRPHVPR